MKAMYRIGAAALAAVLLLSGCGKSEGGKGDGNSRSTKELSGVDMNYEDLVDRPDRNVVDCITVEDISSAMGMTMQLMPYATTEKAKYESDPSTLPIHVLTIELANRTREEFNHMAADPAVWTMQVELGEAAFWNADQTELIAYQNGYAVSVSLNIPNADAMRRMMEIILGNLA